MNKVIGILGIAAAIFVVGCKSQAMQKESSTINHKQAVNSPSIAGAWELTAIKTETITNQTVHDLFPDKLPFLIVDLNEMTVFGEDGCNRYKGTIQAKDASTLTLKAGISSFKTPCEKVEDQAYRMAFWKANSYQINGDELILNDADHLVELKYKRIANRYE
ncbi:META domain-containing protein [Myroides sp. DW712]|uniref:META domain-containing protein n=1 Tax=Myroides sp. DW712 TaxID=3389800 RepID=UPI00397B9F2D